MTPKNDIIYDVVGIGNAIVDVLAKVGDGFLTERRLDKGAMTLLQAAEAGTIYADPDSRAGSFRRFRRQHGCGHCLAGRHAGIHRQSS